MSIWNFQFWNSLVYKLQYNTISSSMSIIEIILLSIQGDETIIVKSGQEDVSIDDTRYKYSTISTLYEQDFFFL